MVERLVYTEKVVGSIPTGSILKMVFIDIHSHIDILPNIPKVVEDAVNANVKIILASGLDKRTNRKTIEIASKYNEVKSCLGFYPTDALKLSDSEFKEELKFIKNNKPCAISEVGLDLKENKEETLEKQKKRFSEFIKLSKKLDVPIIVHSRKAEKHAIDLLEKFDNKKIIMHCFSGNFKLVKRIINNKWFFTIPTNIKHSEHFQKIIELTPIQQLLCETDSPFLHPDKKRNNTPKNVVESYKKIAEIKRLPLKKVEKQIEKNYKSLFNC